MPPPARSAVASAKLLSKERKNGFSTAYIEDATSIEDINLNN